ncbi:hypothetical protein EDC04DRAFT_2890158 [Pisolithus marmoratus]|nr:hypothetical protein EDC04DRAFT_2890158 [Pisolithus marmoratus]
MVHQAFPNVRHIEMGQFTSKFFLGLRKNTDLWGDLECVTFRSLPVKFLAEAVFEFQEWLRLRKPTGKPLHARFTRIKRHPGWRETGYLLSMLYNSLYEHCTFEIDRFPLIEWTRVTLVSRTLHMNLPPCLVNMHPGEDIPWDDSMDDLQNALESEYSSDSAEEDYDSEDEEYGWGGDSDIVYGDQ